MKKAFTMIELIFVIVIIGILSSFGVEFLAQAYSTFIYSKVNDDVQSQSTVILDSLSNLLQYRIKDSVIARKTNGEFVALSEANHDYTILEWVGKEPELSRENISSNIIDLTHPQATKDIQVSPKTDTDKINEIIKVLSDNNTNFNDSGIYFIGSNSDIITDYGWDGNLTAINQQHGAIHPVQSDNNVTYFKSKKNQFKTVYEYYYDVWTAYAIFIDSNNNLWLYYDYQPWQDDDDDNQSDENYKDANKKILLGENVKTLQYTSNGSMIKIQICVYTSLKDYAVCKEKTVF